MFKFASGDQDDDADAAKLAIPIHAFDVIIADECHRGYTAQEESKWREVLNHFDGVKIGLTATPAVHTKAFFKEIVYSYDYERAVREGYLVDYDAVAIQSDITLRGVFLKEGEEVGLVNTQTGQLKFETLEDERELPAPTTEIDWTAPDRNRKIVQEIKKYLFEQETQFGHFPKTLIFAQNDIEHVSHCDQCSISFRAKIKVFGKWPNWVSCSKRYFLISWTIFLFRSGAVQSISVVGAGSSLSSSRVSNLSCPVWVVTNPTSSPSFRKTPRSVISDWTATAS